MLQIRDDDRTGGSTAWATISQAAVVFAVKTTQWWSRSAPTKAAQVR